MHFVCHPKGILICYYNSGRVRAICDERAFCLNRFAARHHRCRLPGISHFIRACAHYNRPLAGWLDHKICVQIIYAVDSLLFNKFAHHTRHDRWIIVTCSSFFQYLQTFPAHSNWPLTHLQAVVLHLGCIDEALLRSGDVYLCIRPAPGHASSIHQTATVPELCATWRYTSASGVTCVQRKRISADAACAVTTLTLEMLAEELPHLLRSLLVGVEHAINRVPLDELSVFHPSETAALSHQQHLSALRTESSASSNTSSSSSSTTAASQQHGKLLLLSPLGSPKCGLKRREMINKNKLTNKYALKRMASKTETTTTPCGGDSAAPDVSTVLMTEPPLSNLPLFCLGRSFPHIDSDEESGDDASTIKSDSGMLFMFECTS